MPNPPISCQPPCGTGCLSCNPVTRSCGLCDESNNFTAYVRDYNYKTYRCFDKTYMCDEFCTNCDISGLNSNPPVFTGNCTACRYGYYLDTSSAFNKCKKCPDLCADCMKTTGSCTSCTNIKYTLYNYFASGVKLCTDKVCSSACVTCDIQGGMN